MALNFHEPKLSRAQLVTFARMAGVPLDEVVKVSYTRISLQKSVTEIFVTKNRVATFGRRGVPVWYDMRTKKW